MEELSTVRLLTGSVLGYTDWATWRAHGVTTPKRAHSLDAAIEASLRANNSGLEAWSRTGRGSVALAENDLESAKHSLSEAVAIFRALDNQYGVAVSARRLGRDVVPAR